MYNASIVNSRNRFSIKMQCHNFFVLSFSIIYLLNIWLLIGFHNNKRRYLSCLVHVFVKLSVFSITLPHLLSFSKVISVHLYSPIIVRVISIYSYYVSLFVFTVQLSLLAYESRVTPPLATQHLRSLKTFLTARFHISLVSVLTIYVSVHKPLHDLHLFHDSFHVDTGNICHHLNKTCSDNLSNILLLFEDHPPIPLVFFDSDFGV